MVLVAPALVALPTDTKEAAGKPGCVTSSGESLGVAFAHGHMAHHTILPPRLVIHSPGACCTFRHAASSAHITCTIVSSWSCLLILEVSITDRLFPGVLLLDLSAWVTNGKLMQAATVDAVCCECVPTNAMAGGIFVDSPGYPANAATVGVVPPGCSALTGILGQRSPQLMVSLLASCTYCQPQVFKNSSKQMLALWHGEQLGHLVGASTRE